MKAEELREMIQRIKEVPTDQLRIATMIITHELIRRYRLIPTNPPEILAPSIRDRFKLN